MTVNFAAPLLVNLVSMLASYDESTWPCCITKQCLVACVL